MLLTCSPADEKSTFLPKLAMRAFAVGAIFALPTMTAFAAPISFTGLDVGAGPGSTLTNSNAAQASFASAAGSIGTIGAITFESAPAGSFSSLVVAPGVTISGTDFTGSNLYINHVPNYSVDPSLDGFNTTPGGSKYVELQGGSLTFSFNDPIQFFGAYLTGLQSYYYQDVITFSDGSAETVDAPETGTSAGVGGVAFVGFTDAGKSISSVTITSGSPTSGDFIGVDDVSYQAGPLAPTPEPSPALLVLTGCLSLGGAMFLHRRAAGLV